MSIPSVPPSRAATLPLDIHKRIADEVFPNGVLLRCERCHETRKASPAGAARFLQSGWPKCVQCGETMGLTPLSERPSRV